MHAFPVLFMMYEYFFIDSKVTAELNKREELQVELKNQKEEMKTTVRMFLNTPADINFDNFIATKYKTAMQDLRPHSGDPYSEYYILNC